MKKTTENHQLPGNHQKPIFAKSIVLLKSCYTHKIFSCYWHMGHKISFFDFMQVRQDSLLNFVKIIYFVR